MAADMPVKAPPPPPALYDWSGAYIGFNIGGMSYDVDRTFRNPFRVGPDAGRFLGDFSTNDRMASLAFTPARSGSGVPLCLAWKQP